MVNEQKRQKRRMRASIALSVFLLAALMITTYALFAPIVAVENNVFQMGQVSVELNGGKTIFDGQDLNIEPGYAAKRDFTIENNGDADAYYRLYLENVDDTLADSLLFELYDGDTLLYSKPISACTRENSYVSENVLPAGGMKTLTAVIRMEERSGNRYQGGGVVFDITLDAVQARNNTQRTFE